MKQFKETKTDNPRYNKYKAFVTRRSDYQQNIRSSEIYTNIT